jgi:ATP synthase protein I
MAQDEKPPSFEEFDAKLRRLKGAEAQEGRAPDGSDAGRMNWGAGLQVGIELVAGVAGGTLIGYFLDRWLGTGPLLLIVFFMLGAMAGTLNAYRWMRRVDGRSSGGGAEQ